MTTKAIHNEPKTRFDARLSLEQKEVFLQAMKLGGYRNLSDFILHSAQDKAMEIIRRNEQILASQRDSELFFDAINNAAQPNQALLDAAKEYKNQTTK